MHFCETPNQIMPRLITIQFEEHIVNKEMKNFVYLILWKVAWLEKKHTTNHIAVFSQDI